MKTRKKNRCAFISLLLLMAVLGPLPAGADGAPMVIHTQYRNPSTLTWGQETVWKFIPRNDHQYAVFRNDETQPAMVLNYSDTGQLVGIEDLLSGMESREIGTQNTITLSWGFPVPFDDLQPESPGQTVQTIHKQIGDTRFAYQITKETRLIPFDDAVAQGMLNQRQQAGYKGGVLKLITIRQDQTVLVRQLWKAGDVWWLYEDTDTRRSWREP